MSPPHPLARGSSCQEQTGGELSVGRGGHSWDVQDTTQHVASVGDNVSLGVGFDLEGQPVTTDKDGGASKPQDA